MAKPPRLPIALTIAGSDSGGGAGIQADLKTFAAFGVHGTTAITCLTAQNPARVTGVEPCSPRMVRLQIEAVFAELPPAAIKTGMLFSGEIIRCVAAALRNGPQVPLVVDPVMVATSGARLLEESAVRDLCHYLLPRAKLITPNLPEAEALVGRRVQTVHDMEQAARELQQRFGCAVLLKGGHLRGSPKATDILVIGGQLWKLHAPFIRGVSTHGTGCAYSAAITACLAKGLALRSAVQRAKQFITGAIRKSQRIGRHSVLRVSH